MNNILVYILYIYIYIFIFFFTVKYHNNSILFLSNVLYSNSNNNPNNDPNNNK